MEQSIWTIAEAYDYVNERYVFNSVNYSRMKHLNAEEQEIFAVTHSLLHMQKSLYRFSLAWNGAVFCGDKSEMEAYKEPLVKMLINILKFAEIVEITREEISSIKQYENISEAKSFPYHMGNIAAELEGFDHGEIFKIENVRLEVFEMIRLILTNLNDPQVQNLTWENVRITEGSIINSIPYFMKSK